ncbi:Uma2 family endonuclease [Azospirillum argentinense]
MGAPAIQKPAIQKMDIDEFLAWADRQEPDTRYELVGGQPRAMSPCSQAHSRLSGNIAFEIRRRLRPPCFVLTETAIERDDRGAKVPDSMQIPSVQEVLLVDSRAVRAQLWRRDGRRWIVEDFTEDATLPLASIGAELPLAALYDGIAL